MIDLNDIYPLTDFTCNSKTLIANLEKTGKPLVLTVNGKAKVVVQDAAAYQKMLELVARLDAMDGIREGLESMKKGKGTPAREFFAGLREEVSLPKKKK